MKRLLILALLTNLALQSGCGTGPRRKRKALFQLGSVPTIKLTMSGSDSAMQKREAYLIQSKEGLDSILKQHWTFNERLTLNLDIDFQTHSVLAIFAGAETSDTQFDTPSLKRRDDAIRARILRRALPFPPRKQPGAAYFFIIMEKTDDPFTVEESLSPNPTEQNSWTAIPVKSPKP